MSVLYVGFKPPTEPCCQTDVVQFLFSIECIDAGVSANELANHVGMMFQ